MPTSDRPLAARVANVARLALTGEFACLERRVRTAVEGVPPRLPDTFRARVRRNLPALRTAGRAVPRLLMVAPSLALEGAPISQFELSVGLRDAGAARPALLAARDGPLRARYEAAGITVEIDPDGPQMPFHPWIYEAAVGRLAERLRAFDPDLVFVNTVDCFRAVDAAAVAGLPSIWNIREGEDWRERLSHLTLHPAGRALGCFEYPERIVFVSEDTRRLWSRFDTRGRFEVIPNAIRRAASASPAARASARSALGLGQDDVLILNVGTLCARKGQVDLAVSLGLREALTRAVILTIGADTEGYGARMLASARPQDRGRLKLTPPMDDLSDLYGAADVFVSTARSESSPRVLLEAASAALPIVTTPVGDAPDRFVDGETALFYEPGDVEALTDALARLLGDRAAARQMGVRARDAVAAPAAFPTMIAAYAAVIGAARAPGVTSGSS